MGSLLEFNDTLQITKEQGFPSDVLDLEQHKTTPIKLEDVKDLIFEFHSKKGKRVYHSPPTRAWLAENREGKWIYWGHVFILEQTFYFDETGEINTRGKYQIVKLYDPEYQLITTQREAPFGNSYF